MGRMEKREGREKTIGQNSLYFAIEASPSRDSLDLTPQILAQVLSPCCFLPHLSFFLTLPSCCARASGRPQWGRQEQEKERPDAGQLRLPGPDFLCCASSQNPSLS